MRSYSRSQRVGEQIQRTLAELLRRSVSDPRLTMATITGVKMSADLKVAQIYFVAPGGQKGQEDAAAGFRSAMGFFRRELARQLALRYTPEIRFHYDASQDYGERIDRLLKAIKTDDGSDHTATEPQ